MPVCKAAPMARASEWSLLRDVLREVLLGLLMIGGVLGLFVDVWAIIDLSGPSAPDGLGKELPLFGIMFFLPVQLAAAWCLRGILQRRKHSRR